MARKNESTRNKNFSTCFFLPLVLLPQITLIFDIMNSDVDSETFDDENESDYEDIDCPVTNHQGNKLYLTI